MSTPAVTSDIKSRLLGARTKKQVKFLGETVNMHKLSVRQVLEFQELVKTISESETEKDLGNIKLVCAIIREGCPELAEFSDEEFQEFPLDELSSLSNSIMSFSGLDADKK